MGGRGGSEFHPLLLVSLPDVRHALQTLGETGGISQRTLVPKPSPLLVFIANPLSSSFSPALAQRVDVF